MNNEHDWPDTVKDEEDAKEYRAQRIDARTALLVEKITSLESKFDYLLGGVIGVALVMWWKG